VLKQVLTLAFAYFIVSILSSALAIPPGYAVAVWPAAGIALVGLLISGNRIWPGVFIGSFLANLWIGFNTAGILFDLKAFIVPVGIATGATCQALAGRYLVYRFAQFPNTLSSEKSIILFMFWGGVIACIINSSIASFVLILADIVPFSNALLTMGTWWVGDTIGVLIFSPLLLVWLQPSHDGKKSRAITVTVAIAISVLITIITVAVMKNWERDRMRLEFDRQISPIIANLKTTLKQNITVLEYVEGLFTSSLKVDREEFESFTKTPLSQLPGLQALSWNPVISNENRSIFEKERHGEGFTQFNIMQRNSEGKLVISDVRDEYIVVNYIEPFKTNHKAFGFDVASNKTRKIALQLAKETGEAVATARITLVQENAKQFGFLVFHPLYENGSETKTNKDRKKNHIGYVVGVFRGGDMVAAALNKLDTSGIIYRLSDRTAPQTKQLLIENFPFEQAIFKIDEKGIFGGTTNFIKKIPVSFGKRQWEIELAPSQDFFKKHKENTYWFIMIFGLLLTSLISIFILSLSGRKDYLKKLVDEKTIELTGALDTAEKALMAKSAFLSVVSHEIRTPMTAIIGYADLILDEKISARAKRYLSQIIEGANLLQEQLNDLLDMSKLEAGKVEVESIDFHLHSLLRDATDMIQFSRKKDDKLLFELILSENLPNDISSDPKRIRQIFLNFLSNAVKFTTEGKITISTCLSNGDTDKPMIEIRVSDTGIGIQKDAIENLFNEFTQADSSISRKYAGTGLGLAICRDLTELLGGEIGVESEFNKGSVFWFSFPYVKAQKETVPPSGNKKTGDFTASRSLKILLAEDNVINQKVIAKYLEIIGHTVMLANDGLEAIRHHEENNFDLILMDIRMPEMDGIEAFKIIRQQESKKSLIPVIATTADLMEESVKYYKELGINGVIHKPIDRSQMFTVINDVLGEDIHTTISVKSE